jgi:hypothetical protein
VNITLSLDEKVVEEARKVALQQGSSLNELIRRYLAGLAGVRSAGERADAIVSLFENHAGDSGGARITGQDAYEGRT